MTVNGFVRIPRGMLALSSGAVLLLALGGCNIKHPSTDLVKGKQLFVSKCGSCHTLGHAATQGTVGPNLDDAFRQDRVDGVKSTSIQGLVSYWIHYPNSQGVMPANCSKNAPFCFSSQEAENVAAYVAHVAAIPGQDSGALANAGGVTGTSPAAGKKVFTGIGSCGSCHTLAAAGTHGVAGPDLDQRLKADCANAASMGIRGKTLEKCIYTAIVKPYAYLPAGFHAGVMPSNFAQSLKPNEVQALVNFIASATK